MNRLIGLIEALVRRHPSLALAHLVVRAVSLTLDDEVPVRMRLVRLVRPPIDLPAKVRPEEFGGGRLRGRYTQGEIERFLCSRGGCGRRAHATWGGCADGNVLRPLCAEHDIEMNRIVEEWWGDPRWEQKVVDYANGVQAEIDRVLDIPWLTR